MDTFVEPNDAEIQDDERIPSVTADSEESSSGAERLQKILSRAGVASRRKAEQLILEGRVTVTGKTVTELGSKHSERFAPPTAESSS